LEQLRATLTAIAETADARMAELEEKAAQNLSGDVPFPERLHLNSLGLRFQLDHERLFATWARWALEQTRSWESTTDPGSWDHRTALA
jgi:hypothetical protein